MTNDLHGQMYWNDNGVVLYFVTLCLFSVINFSILCVIFPNKFVIKLNLENSQMASFIIISILDIMLQNITRHHYHSNTFVRALYVV
jgi:hypothetical protein